AAAGDAGLAAVRYRYNGQVCDSGGGGQLSIGGPSADRSPFFVKPSLLPGLLRYANRHPSLSYAFAPPCIGSASQGPRPDEGVRERFDELGVALELLEARIDAGDAPSPDQLWNALAPLLVDGSGNSHRAEVNVEKLWSPHLGARGKLGVVELRSLSMPETPQRITALAALFRAIAARLTRAPYREPLVDWGASLHDRFALPTMLMNDLREVLDDLEQHEVGLGPTIRAELLRAPEPIVRTRLDEAELVITAAREFWPLLGDTASQEHAGARLVDASTERLEIVVRTPANEGAGTIRVAGVAVPLVPQESSAGGPEGETCHLAGVRYRAFVPAPGLHESLPANDPVEVEWRQRDRVVTVTLHAWTPAGGGYDGLPTSAREAARRRKERAIVRVRRAETTVDTNAAPSRSTGSARFTVDLRRPPRL
ncbi:MAG: transglutaminase family protein, partial [Polyangiales bacterium]